MRTKCSACYLGPVKDMKHCHECGGKGYIETFECRDPYPEYPKCPISYEPAVHGWLCEKCGRSGPV